MLSSTAAVCQQHPVQALTTSPLRLKTEDCGTWGRNLRR